MKIVGVFQDLPACEHARRMVCDAGVEAARVELSRPSAEDGIAAEAPGQSFENQPGQPEDDSAVSRYGESLRSGACALSVTCDSAEDREWIDELLRRAGSTGVWVT
jgi:hypothetical protein